MPVTQEEIAQELGVSRRLVGSALSGNPRVGAATRKRVEEAAARLGYQPNRMARALVTGRTYQIALYLPNLDTTFNTDMIRQFEMLARHTPYDLIVLTYNSTTMPASLAVDGTICYGPTAASLPLENAGGGRPPIVVLQARPYKEETRPKAEFDIIELDLEEASREAMRHLIAQGYQRIALVSPPSMMVPDKPRYGLYCDELEKAGLIPEFIPIQLHREERLREKSAEQLADYFAAHGYPDALFCSNDDVAVGAYRALRRAGREIPTETAILGCDDVDLGKDLTPSLSTIQLPMEELCTLAWEQLLCRIENTAAKLPATEPLMTGFKARLVIRQSSVQQSSVQQSSVQQSSVIHPEHNLS